MTTIRDTQLLDAIADDLIHAIDYSRGECAYVDKDYNNYLHVAIGCDVEGVKVSDWEYIDGRKYEMTPDFVLTGAGECELCECWLLDNSEDVQLDLDYIDDKIQQYLN